MHINEISRILHDAAALPEEEMKRFFDLLYKCRKESEKTEREIKKYDSMKNVMMEEITGKYRFYEFFFSKVFAEREQAIKKDFEVIDQGMKENNRDLINIGVSGLSKVVSSSPFTDIDALKKILESQTAKIP